MGDEFDVDEHIRKRRSKESLGVRFDPRTQSHVEFPLISSDVGLLKKAPQAATGVPPVPPPSRPAAPATPSPGDDVRENAVRAIARLLVAGLMARPFLLGMENSVRFLRGGLTAANVRHSFQKRPYFGAVSVLPAGVVKSAVAALMDDGIFGTFRTRMYGKDVLLLTGTPEAEALLSGRQAVPLDALRKMFFPENMGFSEAQARLFEQLRKLRWNLSTERGVPPFMVATDRVLDAIVRKAPRTPNELEAVPGVGAVFIEKYGAEFIRALNAETPT